jgi:beta-lactamase class A
MEDGALRIPAAIALCAALASGAGASPADAKQDALWEKLRGRVLEVERRLDGVLGLSLKDLASGRTLEIRQDELFPQASTIKWTILYELYRQADEGRVDLAEITRPTLPRAGGDGILQRLGPTLSLSFRDLAVLMMGLSDNEATNLLIAKVGLDDVNRRLGVLGLQRTRLRRRMMDLEAARRGEENVATPAEMRAFLESIRSGTGLTPASAKDLLDVAATPKSSPFRRPLPAGLRVADKPGSLEGVRAAAAIVELPRRPYVVAIAITFLKRDEDGEDAIAEISKALYETFDRLERGADTGRLINPR